MPWNPVLTPSWGLFPSSISLPVQYHWSHGWNVIYTLTTLKYTSLADFSPEFQSHSTCCLVDRFTWVFNRHLKLNLSNTCPFHTHPHLSKRHLYSCTCSGQSCWRHPLLPFISFHLLHQQILLALPHSNQLSLFSPPPLNHSPKGFQQASVAHFRTV